MKYVPLSGRAFPCGTKEARLILQSGIYMYLLTNISEGMAFLLQGLTYNETLQFENKRIACNMIL